MNVFPLPLFCFGLVALDTILSQPQTLSLLREGLQWDRWGRSIVGCVGVFCLLNVVSGLCCGSLWAKE